jgi:hypothetical protein
MSSTIIHNVKWGLLALFLSAGALADDVLYQWSTSDLREDGSPITGLKLYHIKQSIDGVEQPEILVSGEESEYRYVNAQEGTYSAQIRVSEDGLLGEWSDSVGFVLGEVPVSPPAKKTFTISLSCTECELEVQ